MKHGGKGVLAGHGREALKPELEDDVICWRNDGAHRECDTKAAQCGIIFFCLCVTCKQRFRSPFGRDLTSPTLRNTSRIGGEGIAHGTLLACECRRS